ncbi:MAG: protein kinase [Chloroflexi bacterium]|nr:protein kinase [Chloroflexota bacterium]
MPTIFTYGDYIGDIKIVRLLRLYRTAAIYEAEWEGLDLLPGSYRRRRKRLDGAPDQRVLVKVAHRGSEEALKREATLLAELAKRPFAGIPSWLPPFIPSGGDFDPDDEDARIPKKYGKAVFRGETKYYLVLEYIEGSFLRDLLYENPEPWYRDAAYITIGVSQTLSMLHRTKRMIHGSINPDSILVTRSQKTRIPHITLLDLGVMFSEDDKLTPQRIQEIRNHVHPAYAAPEMFMAENYIGLSLATDVYGLGLLLYELLSGKPPYEYALRNDDEIIEDIKDMRSDAPGPQPLQRLDVARPKELNEILMRATAKEPTARFPSLGELRTQLITLFGDIPPEPRNLSIREASNAIYVVMILLFVLSAIGAVVLVLLNALGI